MRAVRDALVHAKGIEAVVLVGDGLHVVHDDPPGASRNCASNRARPTSRSMNSRGRPTIKDLFVA